MSKYRLGIVCAAMLFTTGCDKETDPILENAEMAKDAERGLLRMQIARECLKNLPEGPRSTQYNDWDEVVEACSQAAFYQSNGCKNPRLCLDTLNNASVEPEDKQ